MLLAWLFVRHDPVGPEGRLHTVTLRYWRYGSPPGNPVGAWLARHVQRLDQARQGIRSREPILSLDGIDLLWSYSNPTSGWYQFGNLVGGSNVCYWSFALPRSSDPKSALDEFPNLRFNGPESNAWVSLVGAADCSFQTNTVGHGGIRLPVGRSLFVRHTSESNRTYLVQCEQIKPGTWGDTKVHFRYVKVPSSDSSAPAPSANKQDIRDRTVARRLFESWKVPCPPFRIAGNIHYVGASGVSSFLITTPEGHILIDTGFEDTVPLIQTNIAALGFQWRDIKLLLASHAHVDHVGGHARMKELTGATIVMSEADAALLARGGRDDFSPFPADLLIYPVAKADRIVRDGEMVTLGGITLTCHLTPGHTQGATTWTMRADNAGRPLDVMFFSSLSLVEGTRLRGNPIYPRIVEDYRSSLSKLKALPCDLFLAPHGGAFALMEKAARLKRGEQPNPFIDPKALPDALAAVEAALRNAEDASSN